jgi:O-antigen/teichoic acid export membrane protein
MRIGPAKTIHASTETPVASPPSDPIQGHDVITAAKNGSISFVGRLFEYTVRFIFSIVVARTIGAEQFGLYTLGLTVVQILSMFVLLGLQTGMVRFLPPAIRQRDEASVWGIIQVGVGLPAVLGIAFAAAMFLLAGPLASQGFHDPRLAPVFRLVCLSIPLDALAFVAYTIIQSFKRLDYSVIANNVVEPLIKLLLTVGFLAIGFGMLGILAAHVIASAIGLGLLIYYINSLFSLKRSFLAAKRNVGQLLRYSLGAHPGWVINTLRGTFETLVLGVLGLTTGVGVYSAAARLSAIGNMLFLSIAGISAPIIADLYARGEPKQLKTYYQTTTKWLVAFNLPLFLTFTIFAAPLLSIFGADFTTGATGLMILAVGTFVYTGTGVGATVLDMTDHTKLNSVNSALMVVIGLGLDVFCIPRWGVIGAAIASTLSTILINVVCLIEVQVLLHMQPYDWSFFKPIAAGVVTLVVTYVLNQHLVLLPIFQLLIGGTILWGVYGLVLIALKFSPEDLLVVNHVRAFLRLKLPFIQYLSR